MQIKCCRFSYWIVYAGRLETAEIIVRHFPCQPRQQFADVKTDHLGGAGKAEQPGAAFVGDMDIAAPVADQEAVAEAVDGAGVALLDFVLNCINQSKHRQCLQCRAADKPDEI